MKLGDKPNKIGTKMEGFRLFSLTLLQTMYAGRFILDLFS